MKITVCTLFRSCEDWMRRNGFRDKFCLIYNFVSIKYTWVVFQMRHFDSNCNDFLKEECSWTKCSPKTTPGLGREVSPGPCWEACWVSQAYRWGRPSPRSLRQPLLSSGKPLSQRFLWDECQRHLVYLYILVIIGCVLSHCESITQSQKNDHWPVPTDTIHTSGVSMLSASHGSQKVCPSFIFRWW